MKYVVKTLFISLFVAFATAVAEEPMPTSLVQDQVGGFQSNTLKDSFDRATLTYEQGNTARVVGLREAIQILTAAKHPEAVAELKRHLGALELSMMQQTLDSKQKEIDRLRIQLSELQSPQEPVQILVSMSVIQVSLTKLRDLKLENEYINLLAKPRQNGSMRIIDDSSGIEKMIKDLVGKEVAYVSSEPTLALMNGRQGFFHTGGEVPSVQVLGDTLAPRKYIPFGTMISAMPVIQKDGRLRLSFSFEQSDIDRSLGFTDGKSTIPGFQKRQFNTSAELRSGQLLVMNGMRSERVRGSMIERVFVEHVEECETLVLVKAEFPVTLPN